MTFTNPYSSVSISGYNANPPSDDGTQASQNEVTWAKIKEKLSDALRTAVESVNTNVNSAFSTLTTNLNTVDARTTSFGDIGGLYISNNGTDAEHDVDISIGRCRDAGDTVAISLTSATSKRIDGTWVAGSGNGGLASGVSLSADTWYAFHVIRASNGTVDAGFDNSSTATNLLADSGYTTYRRIGWVKTDASSNILAFKRVADWYYWGTVPDLDYNNSNPGTSAVTVTLTTPPAEHMARIRVLHTNTQGFVISSPDVTDQEPSSSAAPLQSARVPAGGIWSVELDVPTNSSSQIRYHAQSSGIQARIATVAWMDARE